MPYPAKVDQAKIINTARQLLESDGLDALTVARLADELDIKAPSLYRHFKNKNALLRALNTVTAQEITDAMKHSTTVNESHNVTEQLVAMMRAYRDYAHEHPTGYLLTFASTDDEIQPDKALLEALVIPLQERIAQISGEERSLHAIRGAWAMLHGFVVVELTGRFRRGGDIDEAFEQSIRAYIAGWSVM